MDMLVVVAHNGMILMDVGLIAEVLEMQKNVLKKVGLVMKEMI
jgi:hypothetical protein